MDALSRLQQLMNQRGWTMYRLAKECGINEATIVNAFRRQTQPSLQTLEALCKGLNITLAQFFADGETIEITPEIQTVLELWFALSDDQKQATAAVMKAFVRQP